MFLDWKPSHFIQAVVKCFPLEIELSGRDSPNIFKLLGSIPCTRKQKPKQKQKTQTQQQQQNQTIKKMELPLERRNYTFFYFKCCISGIRETNPPTVWDNPWWVSVGNTENMRDDLGAPVLHVTPGEQSADGWYWCVAHGTYQITYGHPQHMFSVDAARW